MLCVSKCKQILNKKTWFSIDLIDFPRTPEARNLSKIRKISWVNNKNIWNYWASHGNTMKFKEKPIKNRCPCDFSLDFTVSKPWIHMLQKRNFHWISMWRPWCEKLDSQPRSHAGTRCPWTRFLEFMHAFQDSVPEFIQKRFSQDFISTVQWRG